MNTAHDKLNELYHECLHFARTQEQVHIHEELEDRPTLANIALGEASAFFQITKQLGEEGYG